MRARHAAGYVWGVMTGLLLATASSVHGQAVVRIGSTHASGTVAESVATGIAWTIPSGYKGRLDSESGLFVLTGVSEAPTVAVWAFSEGAPTDVADAMVSDLEEAGLSLSPDEVTEHGDDRLEGTFSVYSDEGRARLFGVVQRGSEGNTVGVAALGGPDRDAALRQVVREVVESVRWTTPGARTWRTELAGTMLVGGSSAGDFSTTDPSDVAAGVTTDTRIVLCGDGSYEFSSERLTTVSSSTVSGYAASEDSHAGAWSIVADVGGGAWLILSPWDREERYYAVEPLEGGASLDGRLYSVEPAGC